MAQYKFPVVRHTVYNNLAHLGRIQMGLLLSYRCLYCWWLTPLWLGPSSMFNLYPRCCFVITLFAFFHLCVCIWFVVPCLRLFLVVAVFFFLHGSVWFSLLVVVPLTLDRNAGTTRHTVCCCGCNLFIYICPSVYSAMLAVYLLRQFLLLCFSFALPYERSLTADRIYSYYSLLRIKII